MFFHRIAAMPRTAGPRRRDLVLAVAGLILLVVPLPTGTSAPNHPALLASLIVLLAIEEAGVPLPIPGDAGVLYRGYLIGRGVASPWAVVPALLAALLSGATLLYGRGRWWGGSLPAPLLRRVPPARLERARALGQRYGVLAVAVARAVPGMRIACSLLAGTAKIPYLLIVGGVTLCSSLWIAVLLVAGGRFSLGLLAPALHSLGAVLLALAVLISTVRLWRVVWSPRVPWA
jgi:membrane protein DedA with SNARE-associated domain